ncbi:hypothetical protein [Serratia symbiotica]|uniref:hypothetical protein n=1 Tax=Serratia symbiotica TaxID=138074 RepID=UPI0013603B98|nr:hypothetical protein [Serratia symbiotica]MBQ0955747.1 hypothetical protein [Serratia symbiotica]
MSDLTQAKATVKSCQLSSLLEVIVRGDIPDVEKANLLDLASDLAGEIAVFMMDQDSSEVAHA